MGKTVVIVLVSIAAIIGVLILIGVVCCNIGTI
jgi:hypothetical protein